MPLSPYIAFSGNCAAAIAFYQQALGAELIHKITWGEMPQNTQDAEDGCPSGQHLAADGIAHASLRIARAQGATQTLTGLQGHYHYDHARAQHQLTIRQLRYLQGDYSLHATLGGQAPMPLQWQAQARLALPATPSAAPASITSVGASPKTNQPIASASSIETYSNGATSEASA